ncbi:hypothetical protein [Halorubrum trapanicum]|uniref:hypothetical protein n=1 Tax=Halorubrum trapanicum TaxID=29284 RepID=UPI000BBA6EAA|nr:hypothetical protein [Halorubrum trapanicum]
MTTETRLYGAAIAFASGGYSLASAAGAARMTASAWLMLGLGLVVVAHGGALLASVDFLSGRASGGLMVAYAVVMLANQTALLTGAMGDGAMGASAMDGGMTGTDGTGMAGGDAAMTAAMSWDLGMVTLALLMFVSGAIMLRDDGM